VYETWSFTLREEHRLKVFENRVLRVIFGPKRDEVTGEWGKLHNGELHNLYSIPDIIRLIKTRRMRWAGLVACMVKDRKVCKVLVGKLGEKRPFGTPRHGCEDGIIMGFARGGGGREVYLPGSAQGSLASSRESGDEPCGSGSTELKVISAVAVI
jgi:hypothetical protein